MLTSTLKKIDVTSQAGLAGIGLVGGGGAGYAAAIASAGTFGKMLAVFGLGGPAILSAPVLIPAAVGAGAALLLYNLGSSSKARLEQGERTAEAEGFIDGPGS